MINWKLVVCLLVGVTVGIIISGRRSQVALPVVAMEAKEGALLTRDTVSSTPDRKASRLRQQLTEIDAEIQRRRSTAGGDSKPSVHSPENPESISVGSVLSSDSWMDIGNQSSDRAITTMFWISKTKSLERLAEEMVSEADRSAWLAKQNGDIFRSYPWSDAKEVVIKDKHSESGGSRIEYSLEVTGAGGTSSSCRVTIAEINGEWRMIDLQRE